MESISYNLKTLRGFCNDDETAIKTFLQNYIINAKDDLINLEHQLADKKYEEVKNTAHKMKNIISLIEAEPCTSNVNIIMNWEKDLDDDFVKKTTEFIENTEILFKKILQEHQL